jgi:hypothetical protein
MAPRRGQAKLPGSKGAVLLRLCANGPVLRLPLRHRHSSWVSGLQRAVPVCCEITASATNISSLAKREACKRLLSFWSAEEEHRKKPCRSKSKSVPRRSPCTRIRRCCHRSRCQSDGPARTASSSSTRACSAAGALQADGFSVETARVARASNGGGARSCS